MDLSFLNDMNSGVALAVLGYFGFILKDVPYQIWYLIKQRFSVVIQCHSFNCALYSATNSWCLHRFPSLYNHIQKEGFGITSLENNIATDTYYFLHDWCTLVIISKYSVQSLSTNGIVPYEIRVTVIGKHRNEVLKDYNVYVHKNIPNPDDYLSVASYTGDGLTIRKSFDDIFLNINEDIKRILDNFMKLESEYKKHGVIYKTGFLFYGEPGSGKSTLARAIASYLNWGIYIVNDSGALPDYYVTNKVILIEDIDCLVSDNRDDDDKSSRRYSYAREKITLHSLLNYIDGVNSPSNCIFIATTNYIDRIDPALKRKGRFDHIYEVPYIDRPLGEKMCDRFNVSYDVLDNIEFPVSAADIQAEILYNKTIK